MHSAKMKANAPINTVITRDSMTASPPRNKSLLEALFIYPIKVCSDWSSQTKQVICEVCFLADLWHKSMVKQVIFLSAKLADHFCLRVQPELTLIYCMY